MAIPDVKIVQIGGGLGRPSPGEDYYSGLLFYTNTLPSGFSSSDRIKQVLSVVQAEQLGILADYSDETQAQFTIQYDTIGNTGEWVEFYYQEPINNVFLGRYKVLSTQNTSGLQCDGLAAAINALTNTHGYVAVSNGTDMVTVTVRKGLGIYPNSGSPLTWVQNASPVMFIIANQQSSSGVASLLAQWHYHIAEYYRLNVTGNLTVMFAALSGNTFDFAELGLMTNYVEGKLRQVGVYLANTDTFASASDIVSAANLLQTECAALTVLHAPMSVIVGTDMSGISDLTTLQDLSALSDPKVSVTIGQDGSNLGYQIFKAQGYSITDVGAQLGMLSSLAVNESTAYVEKCNYTNGLELSVPAYANGVKVDFIADTNLLAQLDNYRYIFLRRLFGKNGTYINNNHCAVTFTSDYAYQNDNRVFDKMSRLLYAGYVSFLSGTIRLKSDGTFKDEDVAYLTSLGRDALSDMLRNGEISALDVVVDPTQKILQTNKLVVAVSVVPDGVARNIEIDLGFKTSL